MDLDPGETVYFAGHPSWRSLAGLVSRGLLSRELHHTRLERVQNVRARQSLLERMLGIGTVEFDTAAEVGAGFTFSGVADPRGIVRTVDGALGRRPRRVGAPRLSGTSSLR